MNGVRLFRRSIFVVIIGLILSTIGIYPVQRASAQTMPTITSFSPTSGIVGTTVTITGTNFIGVSAVQFNATAATTFTVVSPTSITATTPAGATTGPISVTTPGGTATSSTSFTVIQPPTITSFTPTSGPVGTSVTITGTNFTGATAIQFNGVVATRFNVGSATSITVMVPYNAKSGSISVTTPGGTVTSSSSFTVITPTTPQVAWAWGDNFYGELGDGTNTDRPGPVRVNGLSGITSISASGHTLALKSDGTVWAWGWNTYGQLGDGTTTNRNAPLQVNGLGGITAVSAGIFHSLALKSDGTVWAWGFNAHGNLGDGTTTEQHTPVQVNGLTNVMAIAADGGHSLALKSDGTVWAWGDNSNGDLGDGTTTERHTPVQVSGLTNVIAIAAGPSHSLALKSDGTVWAWGDNGFYQLGDGTTTDRYIPIRVSGVSGVTSIAAGSNYSLVLKADGTVWAWGTNSSGSLGDGTTMDRSTPVQVNSLGSVTAISAGTSHNLALKSDGTVWAWGYNADGELGDGTTTNQSLPIQVSSVSGVTAIAAGNQHSLILKPVLPPTITSFTPTSGPVGTVITITGTNFTDTTAVQFNGTAASFTINSDTSITATAPAGATSGPIAVTTPAGTVTSSTNFTVVPPPAISGFTPTSGATGTNVTITGTNLTGTTAVQFKGMPAARFTVVSATSVTALVPFAASSGPISVTTPGGTATSSTNYTVTASALTQGARAWGFNYYGQMGDGTTIDRHTPVNVLGLSGVTAIAERNGQSLAVKSDGTVWVWGIVPADVNSSGLSSTATQLPGLNNVTTISAGAYYSIALKSDGTVWYWGQDTSGTPTYSTPVQVSGLSNVTAIAAGGFHVLALKSDGTVWAWGQNSFGEVGDGTTTNRTTPIQVSGLSNVTAIAAGWSHSLALKSDGTVWAWGWNNSGQIGDGTNTNRISPIQVLSGATAIAAGTSHSLALKSDGTVWAWGQNSYGQVGDNTTTDRSSPVQVSGLSDVTVITGGGDHTLALKSDGTAWAWGWNANGQLGDGTTTDHSTPVQVSGLSNVTAIAADLQQSLAIAPVPPTITSFTPTSGPVGTNVTITGTNFTGATSVKFSSTAASFTVVSATSITATVPSGVTTGAISVTTQGGIATSATSFIAAPTITSFTPTIGRVGTIVTIAGTNLLTATSVQFNGTAATTFTVNSNTSITATAPIGVTTGAISVTTQGGIATSGTSFTVLPPPTITSFTPTSGATGTIVTITGTNFTGATAVQFNGVIATRFNVLSATSLSVMVPYGATTGPISVTTPGATATSGTTFTAIPPTTSQAIWSWGSNFNGKLGDGTEIDRHSPVQLSGVYGITQVAASNDFGQALKSDGTVLIWGNDSSTNDNFAPAPLNGITNVTALAGGDYHAFALKSDGTVWGWGANYGGALGYGLGVQNELTPVQLVGLTGVTVASAGYEHSIVLMSDGTVGAWSDNSSSHVATQVPRLTNVIAIAAGTHHNLALRSDGTVWIWYADIDTPTQVPGLSGITAISGGTSFSLALKSDGTVWAWGSNLAGELGDGTTTEHDTPIQVPGLSGVTAISAGYSHSLALKSDGTLWVWGANEDGQLGDGTTTNRYSPTQVPGLTGVTYISAGDIYSLVLRPIQPATITSFTPTSGLAGTSVSVTGTDFTDTTAVQFNGTATSFIVNSDTSITATVPAGATSGPISVTTPAGTTTSSTNFNVLLEAPTSLSASAAAQAQINLTWTDNASTATAYKIERSLDGSTNWAEIGSVAANATSYQDTSANCGTTYYYQVRAYRDADTTYSPYSNVASATTPACSLGTPTLLTPANNSLTNDNTPIFTWSAVTNADTYQIQIDNNSDFSSPEQDSTGNTLTYTASTLADGTNYFWHVRARRNDNTVGPWSAPWAVSLDQRRIAAPTLSAPANAALLTTLTPTFSWAAVTGATQYKLQVDNDADFSSPVFSKPLGKVITSVTQATDGLVFGQTYYWRVAASDMTNIFSAWSSIRSFTINIMKTPTNGAYSTTASTAFAWNAVSGASAYTFEVSGDPNFGTLEDHVTGTALTHASALTPGLHYWHVKVTVGVHTYIMPTWSLVVTTTLPAAPTLISPAAGSLTGAYTPTFTWHPTTTALGGPFSYQIQIATTSTFYGPLQDVVQPDLTYTASSLPDGIIYWRVRAINAYNTTGAWSQMRSFTIDTTPPAPAKLVAPKDWSAITTTRPAFSWTPPTGGKTYTLQIYNYGPACTSLQYAIPNLKAASYSLPALQALTPGNYCWNVLTMDALGNGPSISPMFHFTVNSTVIKAPATPKLITPVTATSWKPDTLPALTWSSVPGSTYEVQIGTSAAFTTVVQDFFTAVDQTSYPVTPQLSAGVYSWHVRAINAQNVAGAFSATWTFTVQDTQPATPTLVTPAQNSSLTSLHPTLTWKAATGAKYYVLDVARDSGFSDFVVNDKTISAASYAMTAETLAYGQTYYWRVMAFDAAGNYSDWSTPFQFTVTVHIAPANGSATTLIRPTFTWQAVSGATQYHLQVATDALFGNVVAHYDGPLTKYPIPTTVSALGYGTYYWHVTVDKLGGPVTMPYWMLIVTSNVPGTPLLAAPATNGLTNDNTPYFSWKAANNAQNYEIQIATDTTFTNPVKDALTSGLLAYNPPAVADGKYYWRVRSLNANNAAGAWSAAWNLTIDTQAPAAPVVLGPADQTTTTNPNLTLRWNAATGAVKYEVAIDTNNPPTTPPITLGNATSYVVAQKLAQGTYYWEVRAIDAAGNISAWNAPVRSFKIAAGLSSQSVKPTPTATVEPTFAPPTNTPVATSSLPLVTVEAESATVVRTGTWTEQSTDNASGGKYLYSSGQPGDALTLGFSGTQLDIVFVKHPAFGSFAVEIDGTLRQTIDAHSDQTTFGADVSITDLTSGTHILRVHAVQGTVAFDAFHVEALADLPAIAAPTATPVATQPDQPTAEATAEPTATPVTPTPVQLVTVEAESDTVVRSGQWTTQTSDSASGGSYMFSSGQAGDALTLGFSGTQATIVYVSHPEFGSFNIEVDGVVRQTVVATADHASFDTQVTVIDLAPGAHILRVYGVQGTVAFDAFRVEAIAALPPTTAPTVAPTVAPTEAATAASTQTVEPITQETDAPTATDTPAATVTPTDVPTDAPTATPTEIPPTATDTPSPTQTAVLTATDTPTATTP